MLARLQSNLHNVFGCSLLGNISIFYGLSIREMPGFSNIVSLSRKHCVICVRPCGKVSADLAGGHAECNVCKTMEWVTASHCFLVHAYSVALFSTIKLYVSCHSVLLSVVCIVWNTKYALFLALELFFWRTCIAGTWNIG
jgi:hypothetical protein